MSAMRTTLTLDADVAELVRKETLSGKRTLKEVVNQGLRRGLGAHPPPSRKVFKVKAHRSPYQAGVDRGKLNQLLDELDADHFGHLQDRRSSCLFPM